MLSTNAKKLCGQHLHRCQCTQRVLVFLKTVSSGFPLWLLSVSASRAAARCAWAPF